MPVRARIHSSEVSTYSPRVVVRHHPRGHVDAEPRDPDRGALGRPDHPRSTAKVSVPRAAKASPTCAVALPRPIGPRIWSISQVNVRTSPGSTIRLNRQSSIPAKNAILPRSPPRREPPSLLSAPSPRRSGRPASPDGQGSARETTMRRRERAPRATTRLPGSSSTTPSSSMNGSRWEGSSRSRRDPNGVTGIMQRPPRARAAHPRSTSVRVALRRPDWHPGRRRDLLDESPSASLRTSTRACSPGSAASPAAELAAELGELGAPRTGPPRAHDLGVLLERHGRPASAARSAASWQAFTVGPAEPRGEGCLAAKLAELQVHRRACPGRRRAHPRGCEADAGPSGGRAARAGAQRLERGAVSVLRPSHEHRITEPLVVESCRSGAARCGLDGGAAGGCTCGA